MVKHKDVHGAKWHHQESVPWKPELLEQKSLVQLVDIASHCPKSQVLQFHRYVFQSNQQCGTIPLISPEEELDWCKH
ncbi:hypothetical protein H5410_064581 [Solanum commersonii]|uniref:Uncharacterized protein n=1 Tax=Solanum commersonii TaxID=4109 RepID=A0A9J5VZ00_SOLCO|nr:hypothetical protein H5410_064581 [Solanum commersonii]